VNTDSVLAPAILASPESTQMVSVPESIPYVDPRPARALKPALLTASLVWLVIYTAVFAAAPFVAYAMSMGTPTDEESSALLMVSLMCAAAGIAMAFIGALCFSRKLGARIVGFILASIPVFSLGGAITNSNIPYAAVLGASIVGATAFGFMFSKSLPYKQRTKAPKTVYRTIAQKFPATYHQPRYYPAPGSIHGTPGGVADATDKFNQAAIDAGVKGEENTAELLKLLLKIPGTSVFHGLKFPGSRNADVDHAVSHGSTVYLIDSKMFRTGVYEWDSYEEQIVSPGNATKNNHMAAVAEGYRRMLPYSTGVVPIVIVHGRNISIGPHRWSPNGVGLFTAEEAMTLMGQRLSDNMPTWNDNPAVRGTLIDNMK
jgi:hypothetical protein